jgi:hypothetical protein
VHEDDRFAIPLVNIGQFHGAHIELVQGDVRQRVNSIDQTNAGKVT